jgi:hypothetical protein
VINFSSWIHWLRKLVGNSLWELILSQYRRATSVLQRITCTTCLGSSIRLVAKCQPFNKWNRNQKWGIAHWCTLWNSGQQFFTVFLSFLHQLWPDSDGLLLLMPTRYIRTLVQSCGYGQVHYYTTYYRPITGRVGLLRARLICTPFLCVLLCAGVSWAGRSEPESVELTTDIERMLCNEMCKICCVIM